MFKLLYSIIDSELASLELCDLMKIYRNEVFTIPFPPKLSTIGNKENV